MAIDSNTARARAERAYEFGRFRRAAVLSTPLLSLSILAACMGTKPIPNVIAGAGILTLALFFLYRGQALGRAVFPGVVAGLVPLAFALGARSYGHVCMPDRCVSLCIPACALGGVLAGVIIARTAGSCASRVSFVVGANAIALLVGALGCSCVGYGGVVGLGVGLLSIMLLTFFQRKPAP